MDGLDYGLRNAELRDLQCRLQQLIAGLDQARDRTVDRDALSWISTKVAGWAKLALTERLCLAMAKRRLPPPSLECTDYMSTHWSEPEVEAAVADYFRMLRLELTGHRYNKTEHRRALMEQLNYRSDGSVELKHQNISAVLIEMGIPYIDGYKPRFNYQRSLLPAAVADFLERNPEFQQLFAKDAEAVPQAPIVEDFLAAWEEPPAPEARKAPAVAEPRPICNPGGVNWVEREARNQSLGETGERFVINFERARLIRAGKESLADRIEQVSTTVGPSAGFDIRSFEENGSDRFIEAKTTKYGKNTPFFVTPNELRFSRDNASRYYLYRLFGFRRSPRLFSLPGHIADWCVLEPSEFTARPA